MLPFFWLVMKRVMLLGLVISWMEEQEHLKKKIIGLNDLNNLVVKFYLNTELWHNDIKFKIEFLFILSIY